FDPIFGQQSLWIGLLVKGGSLTMLVGAMHALRNTDLTRLLAYSTIVSLGTLVVLIGNPDPMAAVALAVFLVGHALYKACLFLVAGIIDYRAGTRDSLELGGLRHRMPITAVVAVLGALSMAGLPPFVGFLAKEVLYEATLIGRFGWLLGVVGVLANAVMVVVAGAVALRCFFGPLRPTPREPSDPSAMMWTGPAVLAVLGILFGVIPGTIGTTVVAAAAEASAGVPVSFSLALWHGLSAMLLLSAVTLAVGVALYRRWDPIRGVLARAEWIDRRGIDAGYDGALRGLQRLAGWQTRLLQHGSLRGYLWATLAVFAAGAGGVLLLSGGLAWPTLVPESVGPILVLPVLLVVAALAVGMAGNFVAGLVTAGVVGFIVAVIYLFQGAPDLAFTQFLVEALAVVILLAIVRFLPFREPEYRSMAQRRNDAALAVGFGAVVTLVLLAVVSGPFDPQLSEFYRAASLAEAHGRNLVNVIIVDFRGLDTLGEITVLSLAALAAGAVILSVRRGRKGEL
ncbi:MAG: hydrogen gas-evolving membrane-bound hydrogenase subunit E, partial [Gemmatimonadales bacterium]